MCDNKLALSSYNLTMNYGTTKKVKGAIAHVTSYIDFAMMNVTQVVKILQGCCMSMSKVCFLDDNKPGSENET